jgi:hypothetical protein
MNVQTRGTLTNTLHHTGNSIHYPSLGSYPSGGVCKPPLGYWINADKVAFVSSRWL